MRYHNITKADMLNGEGLRVVLWVSGCSHKCLGCQNAFTWNSNEGLEFDDSAREELFRELEKDWCSGITFSGGDPLFCDNRKCMSNLVKDIKERFPNKTIWLYTGYTWEELLEQMKTDKVLDTILNNIDVLLDGRFVLELASIQIHYVGSSNQCIIDVPKSLTNHQKILYIDNKEVLENE